MGLRVPKDLRKCIESVMLDFEVEEWDIVNRRKHPMLVFTVGGKTMSYPVSSSPSDRRSELNMRADLRRMCRLQSATA